MSYITIGELSERWGVSTTYIRRLCSKDEIPGAILKNGIWMVPEEAVRVSRTVREYTEEPEFPKLAKRLRNQKKKKNFHLQYTITTVKAPFIYEWCKDQIFWDMDESKDSDFPTGHRNVLKEQDPTPWGANEVYRLYQEEGWYMNWYLLCYEDKIIEIRFDWEPTTEDMAIVKQKLNP